ncbi:MAG: hybrid sensor histidine kinase/response regulator [Verrucomicrobiota bacterium]|nr:hybrid sensor histidine kinase/response regulator [Verrucomicrobiota bacterium]
MGAETKPLGNILAVDDTAVNLRLLTNMLGERGYQVRPVTSGRQALQAAERLVPDLILLDIYMPEIDGYEVCRQLKASETLRDVPVIFLTALTDTADKLKAFSVGGVDYISKPFQIDEVLARVKVHIDLRRAQADLAGSYEQLKSLEKVRDNLVHMIVHDMRSPLAVIMGHLELIRMFSEGTLNEDADQSLEAALAGAKGLTAMTNDLLDVSKMEEGKLLLNRQQCDINALAQEVATGLATLDRSRSISIETVGPAIASCDAAIMRRILQNLMSNAIKHTPSGSSVRVTTTNSENHVRVSVIDDGPGVPAEAREKIFQKFGAAESRKDRKYHSVGLGLAFCKLAVQAHGGRIGVEPNNPKGSVFWFEVDK